jgi:hypothetical protein
MEILAGIAIGAVIVFFMAQASGSGGGGGNEGATVTQTQGGFTGSGQLSGGAAGSGVGIMTLQPGSSAGESGSGSMAPSGMQPPLTSAPLFARPPARFPVSQPSVPRVGFGTAAPYPPPTMTGFPSSNVASTGQGTPPTTGIYKLIKWKQPSRVTFSTT